MPRSMRRSTYPFRGGPWNGFIIELRERARPEHSVVPSTAPATDSGVYRFNHRAAAYDWITTADQMHGIA